jgi:hypothetical protein
MESQFGDQEIDRLVLTESYSLLTTRGLGDDL